MQGPYVPLLFSDNLIPNLFVLTIVDTQSTFIVNMLFCLVITESF